MSSIDTPPVKPGLRERKKQQTRETIARMALHTLALAPDAPCLPQSLLDRHFLRKHGAAATYGQGVE